MAENSKIEWTDHTHNPWRGCTKVSRACDICYAETMSKRNPRVLGIWGKYGTRTIASEAVWKDPIRWDRLAKAAGQRHRVFCASLADVFEGRNTMPEAAWTSVAAARRRLFRLIGNTPNLDWLLLTKRPENIYGLTYEAIDPDCEENDWNVYGDPHGLSVCTFDELYPNIWLGTTVEDRKTLDERVSSLARVPATVHFLSIEPLLEDLGQIRGYIEQFKNPWVIIGTESGARRRPMKLEWAVNIVDQCRSANVPVFVKQVEIHGKVEKNIDHFPTELQIREYPRSK